MTLLMIGIGGFVGAVARYLLDGRVSAASGGTFPWGTLAVNLSGTFASGLLFAFDGRACRDARAVADPADDRLSRLVHDVLDARPRILAHDRGRRVAGRCRQLGRIGAAGTCRGDRWRGAGQGALVERARGGFLLRVYLGEQDTWHGRPLYQAIVERLRERGVAGATVLRGIEGFGAKQHLHTSRILSLSQDLPILIEAVDSEEKIRAIIPDIDAMLGDGLMTLAKVEVIAHRSGQADRSAP